MSKYSDSVKVTVLGSSSAGNATLIRNGSFSLLVDCGLSPRYTKTALEKLGVDMTSIKCVLLTHLHSDHIHKNMAKFIRENSIAFYTGVSVHSEVQKTGINDLVDILSCLDKETLIGKIVVSSFEVTHDSPGGCYGYSLKIPRGDESIKITIATDLGFPEKRIIKNFSNSDVIILESNHDVAMLKHSSRPYALKKRILKTGHLSNSQACEMMTAILNDSVKMPSAIFLAHMSKDCNEISLAVTEMKKCVKNNVGYGSAKISVIPTYVRRCSRTIAL